MSFLIVLDAENAYGEQSYRGASSGKAAKQEFLDALDWFAFYCRDKASTARNEIKAIEWRALEAKAKEEHKWFNAVEAFEFEGGAHANVGKFALLCRPV